MHALLVVDAQNEFSPRGLRAIPNHAAAVAAIGRWLAHARGAGWPIAFVRHYNKPHESRAFVPNSWGSELSPELQPEAGNPSEAIFEKSVFGSFSAEGLETWLRAKSVTDLVIVGFFAHMCLSTSVREALVRDFNVAVDPSATGARALDHPVLGRQSAEEVVRSALLQLTHMGATVASAPLAGTLSSSPPRVYERR